jgi:hypothetical protein
MDNLQKIFTTNSNSRLVPHQATPEGEPALTLVPTTKPEIALVPPATPTLEVETPPLNGKLDPRNNLNDLTGKEWVYFLSSVEATAYAVSGAESYGHQLRKAHPSPKPPQLMRRLIEFFTKREGWVFDPFAGVGGTLLGCSLAGRNGVGVELAPHYAEIYRKVCQSEKLAEQTLVVGDSHLLSTYPQVSQRTFDLILTDPPYASMMNNPQDGEKKKKTGRADPTPFTADAADLGNLPYFVFLDELKAVIEGALAYLKPRGYVVLFTKDLQPTLEHHNMLHADIVAKFMTIENLAYKGYKIWYDKTTNLYPFGYPYQFVANQLHQYILIFQKLK